MTKQDKKLRKNKTQQELDWEAEQEMLKAEAEQIEREKADFEAEGMAQWEAEQEAIHNEGHEEPF